jgi:hypothetical protein
MIVISEDLRLFRGAEQVGYRLYPSGAPRRAQRLQGEAPDGQRFYNLGTLQLADGPAPGSAPPPPYSREAEQAAAREITALELTDGFIDPLRIETGALDEPIEALQVCADELVTHWGLDAEAHRALSRPAAPAGPTAGWLEPGTIPFGEFARLSGGNNELRLLVDAAGRPTACHVQWPSLAAALNESICATVMEKGTFTPALDQAGQPIDSFWTTSLFFLMPGPR